MSRRARTFINDSLAAILLSLICGHRRHRVFYYRMTNCYVSLSLRVSLFPYFSTLHQTLAFLGYQFRSLPSCVCTSLTYHSCSCCCCVTLYNFSRSYRLLTFSPLGHYNVELCLYPSHTLVLFMQADNSNAFIFEIAYCKQNPPKVD